MKGTALFCDVPLMKNIKINSVKHTKNSHFNLDAYDF